MKHLQTIYETGITSKTYIGYDIFTDENKYHFRNPFSTCTFYLLQSHMDERFEDCNCCDH